MSEEIRVAGTVVAARPGPRGVEVLVLLRSGGQRFLPGYVVFPGGAVDAGDEARASEWFGDPREAARACATRELAEEAGLLSTATGLLAVRPGVGPEASADFPGGPPGASSLPQISRWIAPADVPVRFDARFFAIEAPRGLDPTPDGSEAVKAWWARPADLLEANMSGGCLLYWPTMKVLEGLALCDSVADVLAAEIPQVEPEVATI